MGLETSDNESTCTPHEILPKEVTRFLKYWKRRHSDENVFPSPSKFRFGTHENVTYCIKRVSNRTLPQSRCFNSRELPGKGGCLTLKETKNPIELPQINILATEPETRSWFLFG